VRKPSRRDTTILCAHALVLLCTLVAMPMHAQTFFQFNGTDGATPWAGLTQGTNGSIYGATEAGGANGYGTIFSISSAGKLKTLHSFDSTDGAYPYAEQLVEHNGVLYGTTEGGGASGDGTVFKMTLAGQFTTLHSFDGSDGCEISGGLAYATNGDFYGTAYVCGGNGYGSIFQITTGGKFTLLYTFSYSDGAYPYAALTQGTDGNLYGTTELGGANSGGTVFRITPGNAISTCSWSNGTATCTVASTAGFGVGSLLTISGVSPTGYNINGVPITSIVGDQVSYALTTNPGKYKHSTATAAALTTLYSFCAEATCADGGSPLSPVVQANDGNFYGTTECFLVGSCGANGYGTLFRINGEDAISTCNWSDGTATCTVANTAVISVGSLVTISGVNPSGYNVGGVPISGISGNQISYALATNPGLYSAGGNANVLTTLYSFCAQTGCTDGANPWAGLIQASDGNLYGTTIGGGANDYGTAFQFTLGGTFTALNSFGSDDGSPYAGLIQATNGNLYGTTAYGCACFVRDEQQTGNGTYFYMPLP
jgi:uncharacterized repeat protein (TIGR03803 family)